MSNEYIAVFRLANFSLVVANWVFEYQQGMKDLLPASEPSREES